MNALLAIKNQHGKIITPYLPREVCPTIGNIYVSDSYKQYDVMIEIDAETYDSCYINSMHPSETGEAYYMIDGIDGHFNDRGS